MTRRFPFLAGLALCAASFAPPLAGQEPGTLGAYLETGEGARIRIATVRLAEDGSYGIDRQDDAFSDHFLSMRPFKCLEGPDRHWCHVPYPYEIARRIAPDDLTDLEYDFLFLWKGATEYGINMWNGVYYRLQAQDGRLVGHLHQIDMDILSAPPAPGNLRPVREADLEEGDPDSFWLPRLVIE